MENRRTRKILDLVRSPGRISLENVDVNKSIKILNDQTIYQPPNHLDFNFYKDTNKQKLKRRLDFENIIPQDIMSDFGLTPPHPKQYKQNEHLEEKNSGLVLQTIHQEYINGRDSVNVDNKSKADFTVSEASQNVETLALRPMDEDVIINDNIISINRNVERMVEIEGVAGIFQNEVETTVLQVVDQGSITNKVKDVKNVESELETLRNLQAAELEPSEQNSFINYVHSINSEYTYTIVVEDVAKKCKAKLETSNNLEVVEIQPAKSQHITNNIYLLTGQETDKEEIKDFYEILQTDVRTPKENVKVTDVTEDIVKIDVENSQYRKDIKNYNSGGNFGIRVDTVEAQKEELPATYSQPSTSTGNKKRRKKIETSYMDFLDSDEEPFAYSSSSAEFSSDSSSDDSLKSKKHKKKKNKKIEKKQPNEKRENIEKKPKKKDKERENTKKKHRREKHENKQGKTIKAKEMAPNPCTGKKCGNNCGEIDENRRKSLFTYFNNLENQQRRRDWIGHCVVRKKVGRQQQEESRRSVTNEYYINEGEGRRKVCQQFIIATLSISQKFILYTIDNMQDGFTKLEGRGKNIPKNKTPDIAYEEAKKYIHSLPLLPSHYCRKDSTRLYLPQETKSLTNLYRLYRKHSEKNKITNVLSEKVFLNWFKNTFNVGIHIPKKDKCQSCTKFNNKEHKTANDISDHEKHQQEKASSYERFKFHQKIYLQDQSTLCASFDLQKVLNTPYGNNMLLFYSRKYAVYNFTIYESVTKEGYCFLWGEADAKRGGNEIATCLQSYIKDVDQRGNIKRLILYCDSCSGQNRNRTVLSMVNYTLNKCESLEIIQLNYLIPGHTYMPVDSVHAIIEKELKNMTVWAPSQWPTLIECARKNPKPYHVTKLDGTDFISWDDIQNKTFNPKGKKVDMQKLRVATFKKNKPNIVFVRYSFLDDSTTTEIALNLKDRIDKAKPKYCLYPEQRPLSNAKYNDLKNLVMKEIIPKQYRDEYLKLPTSKKIIDYLPQSDEEDEDEIS